MSSESNIDAAFLADMDKYEDFANIWQWYPDIALDLLSPKEGGIKLHTDQRIFMRCGARFFSEYGCFPRGWGKCVVGDTLLYTSEGLKEIGSYFDYQDDDEETDYFLALETLNRNGDKVDSFCGVYSGLKPTKKITTQEGYSLEGTYVHPILVLDEKGVIDFKQLKDIKIGDRVVINRKNGLWGDNLDIDYNGQLEKWTESLSAQEVSFLNQRKMPDKLNHDLAYLFGLFAGDGFVIINDKFIFTSCAEDVLESYSQIIRRYFDISPQKFGNCSYIFQDSYLRKYLELCGLVNDLDSVPKCILEAPKEIQASFLSGFFDVSAYVQDVIILDYITSSLFAKQMQLMLLNFGIVSKINAQVETKDLTRFYLSLSGNNVKEFVLQIGFNCNRKKETSRNLSLMDNGDLHDSKYYFAEVTSIQDSKNHVYDLNVPDTNSFVSNGFVSHNTFMEVATMFMMAIRYPNIEIGLTAQTKENAASLLKDKYNELIRYYPAFQDEIVKANFGKGDALITFKNGARVDALANSQSTKGQRRKRINIEESNLMDNTTFEDALEPVVEVGRITAGKLAIINPEELNQQINFFTTPGFRGSDEFKRSLQMVQDMRDLKGKIVLGSNWMLGCWYGRGSSKSVILKKKKDSSPIAFDMNYGGNWVGSATGALVNINNLMKCRTLTAPVLNAKNETDEFYIAMDVARSQKKSNNQSSIAVGQVFRGTDDKIHEIHLVNLIHVSNALNFATQACIVKRVQKRYNAKMVVVDGNGLGVGLIDELMKETYDPKTGETYKAWNTINTTATPETLRAEACLYDLKAQSDQTRIISNFIDMVDSGKFRFLETRNGGDFSIKTDDDLNSLVMPFVQQELFFQETGNLKLVQNGKNLSVEKVVRKFDKDRFSAVAYLLYYIMKVDDKNIKKIEFDAETFAQKLKKLNHRPTMY